MEFLHRIAGIVGWEIPEETDISEIIKGKGNQS
jgi:hypothetical protein